MKKVIALFGIANSGKTTTLGLVYKALMRKGASAIQENNLHRETHAILKIGKYKVGIESRGDPGSKLEESLKYFISIGCHLIICASRTKGWTVDVVEQFAPEYLVSWGRQSDVSESNQQSACNKAMANLIVKEALEFASA